VTKKTINLLFPQDTNAVTTKKNCSEQPRLSRPCPWRAARLSI